MGSDNRIADAVNDGPLFEIRKQAVEAAVGGYKVTCQARDLNALTLSNVQRAADQAVMEAFAMALQRYALMSPRAEPEARFPECAPPTIDPATEKGIREIVAKGYQSVCCRYLKDAMGEVDALRNRLRILSDRLHKFTEDMEGDNEHDWIHSSIHEILDAAAVNRPPASAVEDKP